MINLPIWRLTSKDPAFYDSESGTVIEQTAKVYGAMRDLIEEYNAFVDSINTRLNEYTSANTTAQEEFAIGLRQEFQDFIDTIEIKISSINSNIIEEVTKQINEIEFTYDPATETLNIGRRS